MPETVYRLAPLVVARLVGLALVVLAVLLFAGTAVVALTGLPPDVLVVSAAVLVVALLGSGWWLRSRAYVLRCTLSGYRVGLVRGAGTPQARWSEVEDAVTLTRRDHPCVMLRLRDGRTTTIPAGLLAVDREQFVRELQAHLSKGQAQGPLARGVRGRPDGQVPGAIRSR